MRLCVGDFGNPHGEEQYVGADVENNAQVFVEKGKLNDTNSGSSFFPLFFLKLTTGDL